MKNTPYHLLILGQFLAQMSDRMTSLGLIWGIAENFAAPQITWYLVIGGLPHLLLSPFSGRLLQKMSSLNAVLWTDLFRAILYFIASLSISGIATPAQLTVVMVLLFVANIAAAIFNPAILALPLEVTSGEKVQKLTAQLSTVLSLTTVLGPVVGIFCFQSAGLRGLFFCNVVSYLVSALCVWNLRKIYRPQNSAPAGSERSLVSLAETLSTQPLALAMLTVFLMMNLLLSPLQVQIPDAAKQTFAGSFQAMATMETSLGLGLVLGGLTLSLHSIAQRTLLFCYLFLVGLSICFLLFQLQNLLWTSCLALAGMGFFLGLANVLIINIFQSSPPAEHVPNVMSLVNLIGSAAVPFSLSGLGFLQSHFPLREIGWACALLLFAVSVLSYQPFQKWGKELWT